MMTLPVPQTLQSQGHGQAALALEVPHAIAQRLPLRYGYDQAALIQDCLAAFGEPPAAPRRLKEVVDAWRTTYYRQPGQGGSPAEATALAVAYWRCFHRLRRSRLRRELLALSGGDAVEAVRAFFALLGQRAASGARSAEGLGRALQLALRHGEARGSLAIPFAPLVPAGSRGAGTTHGQLVARAYRLAELVARLRPRYAPYRRRRRQTREVPWPEDLDITVLRGYGAQDLARIVTGDHLVPDTIFWPRLALRQLRQMVYVEPIPAPPATYVMLLDVSRSMDTAVGQTGYSREEYAIASAIALLQSTLAGGHRCVLIRFDAEPYPPLAGTPAEIVTELLTAQSSGGGTNIQRALDAAAAIPAVEEIILITDGDDPHVTRRPRTPLVTYFAGGDHPRLQEWSRAYYRIEAALA